MTPDKDGLRQIVRAEVEEILLELSDRLWAAYSQDFSRIHYADISTILAEMIDAPDDKELDS